MKSNLVTVLKIPSLKELVEGSLNVIPSQKIPLLAAAAMH